jgi:hypothetical protein
MVKLATLNFVEWNDNSLEEIDMFFSQRNSEATNNAGKNIKQFSSSVELEVFVDQGIEAVSDGFSDHFSSWYQLSIESVENVFQIFSFSWLFRVHKLQEFLNENMGDVGLEALDINSIVNN